MGHIFGGLYRVCLCGCRKYTQNYIPNEYWMIYKPYFKYSYSNGRVLVHRYIYHIYLSILNGKPVYIPKDMDVHHINGIKTDNRLNNMVLKSHSGHTTYHNIGNKYKEVDKSGRRCLQCGSDKTYQGKDGYWQWHQIEGGYLCNVCFNLTSDRKKYKNKNRMKNYWKKKNVTNT